MDLSGLVDGNADMEVSSSFKDDRLRKNVPRKTKLEQERARLERLKLASYCPKVSGSSWDYQPKRK